MTDTDLNAGTDPLEDLRGLIRGVPALDAGFGETVRRRLAAFPGPARPLGRLEEVLVRLAAAQRRGLPRVDRPLVAVFAGAQGWFEAAQGAAQHANEPGANEPGALARLRVEGLTQGSAPVRGVAASLGAAFKVYEFGLHAPSADMREGPSLTPRDMAAAFAFGMEVVAEGADTVALGAIGTGSVAAAAAVARGLYGGTAEFWASARDPGGTARVDAVQRAAQSNAGALHDPLQTLAAFGGRDMAGLCGAITAARYQGIAVVLDGFVVTAAAAVLHAVNPDAVAHCVAGHGSGEFAHAALLERMGLPPLLDLGVQVGDGTGAALALGVLRGACAGLEAS